ncbi:hypothetical protein QBC37DRAFT_128724 [Rhypophila decipiens]|uniref:F-box domain-containing protein n=1 Tax=Rhypophila decipiens TaxID=261697 RepID=A0AAN7B9A5_9PEZI|nr:hypothetical protein QBC37DRAFT_128724 [Rhypophila decipiens]
MASESFLLALPQELLGLILARLSAKDQARLARFNRELSQRTLHSLYKPDSGNSVVEWAVTKGAIDTLRRALARGAPVSWVRHGNRDRPTLTLALKYSQDDTFRFLLEQGADLSLLSRSRTRDFYIDNFLPLYLCLYTDRFDVVRRFIEAGLAVHIPNHDNARMLNKLLLRIVEKSADYDVPQGVVEILLDTGADPNRVDYLPDDDIDALDYIPDYDTNALDLLPQGGPPNSTFSPPSYALLADRADLFSFLIEKGANINGPFTWRKGEDEPRLPLHVPVCAAAFLMARADYDSRPMQLCIEQAPTLEFVFRIMSITCGLIYQSARHLSQADRPMGRKGAPRILLKSSNSC